MGWLRLIIETNGTALLVYYKPFKDVVETFNDVCCTGTVLCHYYSEI